MDFTIVIPTYKEERYLPHLLASIKEQTLQPKEIIIGDNNSPDLTRQIAHKFGCKIVDGGIPARGRNNGAKAAQTDLLVFFDSDCRIGNKKFLELSINNFAINNLDIAMGYARNEKGNKLFGKLAIWGTNSRKIFDLILAKTVKNVIGGSGWFIIVKKSIFDKTGGFREDLVNYEDTTFIKDVVKAGYKFGIIPYAHIYLSGRRYDKMSLMQLLRMSLFMFAFKAGVGNKKSQLKNYESTKGPLGGD